VWNERLAQLSPADRAKVVQFRELGLTMTSIAKRFGISTATVSRALNEERKPAKSGGWGRRQGWGEA
jgi:DNA-directed RNA polymerase specialized sigma24 family protein